jgi:hypothetical protein
VTAGETVVDVPATLAARTRVLGTGRSNKPRRRQPSRPLIIRWAREGKQERLEASVTGLASSQPVLRRSHSRTHHQRYDNRQRPVEQTRPPTPPTALLTQRGFDLDGRPPLSEPIFCVARSAPRCPLSDARSAGSCAGL